METVKKSHMYMANTILITLSTLWYISVALSNPGYLVNKDVNLKHKMDDMEDKFRKGEVKYLGIISFNLTYHLCIDLGFLDVFKRK